MNLSDVFYGVVAGVVLASVFWSLFTARLLGRAADELDALVALLAEAGRRDELDELEDWDGWGDIPPIPPHGGVS